MGKFVRLGRECSVCRDVGRLYYKHNLYTCAECAKRKTREYSRSRVGRVGDRRRRRGVKGREHYAARKVSPGRIEQLNKNRKAWHERNVEIARERNKVLARIRYQVKIGGIERPDYCEECGVRCKPYAYVDWYKYGGDEWIPEFRWVCSLCLGKHRQKDDEG
jgi:hypothetical protein